VAVPRPPGSFRASSGIDHEEHRAPSAADRWGAALCRDSRRAAGSTQRAIAVLAVVTGLAVLALVLPS
jgi:hypothetical protein